MEETVITQGLATEQCFPVKLFFTMNKVVQTFECFEKLYP